MVRVPLSSSDHVQSPVLPLLAPAALSAVAALAVTGRAVNAEMISIRLSITAKGFLSLLFCFIIKSS